MSLILEALRKSEDERRRGRAPDLYRELPPAAARRRPLAPRWPWLAAAALLVALVLLAWTLRPSPPSPSPDVAVASPDASASNSDRPGPAAPATPPATAEPLPLAATADGRTPAAATDQRTPAAAPSPDVPEPTVQAPPSPGGGALAAAPDPAPDVAPPGAGTPPRERAATAIHAPADRPADTDTNIAPDPAAASEATAATSPAAHAAASAQSGEPIRLGELSADDRRQLPPLRISMHMWAQAPSERFAIVDGARVGEGDRIGEAVVAEITTDAVVLAWGGRQVRVSIR